MELEILSILIIIGGMIFGLFMGYLLYMCKLKEYDERMDEKIQLLVNNNMLRYSPHEKSNKKQIELLV